MKKIEDNKSLSIVLIITSILTLLIGIVFFLNSYFKTLNGSLIFYIAMLLYCGVEFANYILTKKITNKDSLYKALVCIIASVSGLKYLNEPSSGVIGVTLSGWMFIMLIIKLIRIEDLRKSSNNALIINIFTMSLFILLGFLVITNIFKGITNEVMILGFFFTANGIINLIETIGFIRFKK